MARCGCASKCGCIIANGVCTTAKITAVDSGGCDSPSFIYSIDVKVDNETITCGPNGLQAILHTLDTNTIDLNGDGSAGSPLEAHVIRTPDGQVPDPDGLGTGNLLKELPGPGGGIYVSCEDVQDCVGSAINKISTTDCLDYDDATNTISIKICPEQNGLECAAAGAIPGCPAGGLAVVPSSDPGNTLIFGTDGNLFKAGTAIAPGPCMVFAGSGTAGDPFVISPQVAQEPNGLECIPGQGLAVIPSSDANNNLTFGGDQRLFVNKCPFTNGGSQVLTGNTGPCFEFVGGGCGVPMQATLRLSDDLCQGLACGNDGLYIQKDTTPLPAQVQLVTNFGPSGPFNGNIGPDNGGVTIEGPTCINITNPSPCRVMLTTGVLGGFADSGRTTGNYRIAFDVSNAGPGGPWFHVSQKGETNPMPAARSTGNAVWSGNEQAVPPGGSRTLCSRIMYNTQGITVTNGQIFSGQRTLTLIGRWAQD